MIEFFVGLLVILLISVFSLLALLVMPFVLVLGFFLRFVVGLLFLILVIWVIGKLTLMLIDHFR